jgi:hypothetical protein
MSGTIARFTIEAIAGAGLFVAALALSPDVAAAPLKTGGYECIQDAAGGNPAAGFCAPVADMAGVPMALPGPLPLGAAAVPIPVGVPPVPVGIPPVPVGVPPVPVGVPPVPVGVPPVPVGVPPVPVGVPPVPLGAGALAVPLPVGAPVGGVVPIGAPIIDMAGAAGKGVSTGPPVAGDPVSGQPIPPGPSAAG